MTGRLREMQIEMNNDKNRYLQNKYSSKLRKAKQFFYDAYDNDPFNNPLI